MSWNVSIKEFRVMVINFVPYISVKKKESDFSGSSIKGPGFLQFCQIMDHLKLRYQTIALENSVFGMRTENGTWSGIIGTLQRDEADVALLASRTSDREEVVAFSTDVFNTATGILSWAPPLQVTTDILRLSRVFDKEVWICLLFSMLALILVSCIQVRLDDGELKYKEDDEYSWPFEAKITIARKRIITNLLTCYVSALFLEGSRRTPSTSLSCALFSLWLFSVLILANAFCGLMRATITAPHEPSRITSISDLDLRLHNIQPLILAESSQEEFFKRGITKEQISLWKSIEGGGLAEDENLCSNGTLRSVMQGKSVVLSEVTTFKSSFGQICKESSLGNFYIASEPLYYSSINMVFNRRINKEIINSFNKRIRMYSEGHIMTKMLLDEMFHTDFCFRPLPQADLERTMDFEGVIGILYLHLSCLALAFVSFLAELVLYNFFNAVFMNPSG